MSGKSFDDRIKETSAKKEKLARSLIPPKALQSQIVGGQDDKDKEGSTGKAKEPLSREEDKNSNTPPPASEGSSESHSEGSGSGEPLLSSEDEIRALQQRLSGDDPIQERRSETVQTTPTYTASSLPAYTDPIGIPYRPKRYKKERLVDTHEQKSYYMEKEIVQIIDELAGDDTGFKYRFVNEAVRLLLHQDYPHLVHRLRPQNK